MKKIVFATEEDHQHKKTILQKSVTRALTGTMPRPVFLCLQRKQDDLDFPTRENGKSIILFFISFGIPLYLNDEIQRNCILLDLN